MDEHGEKFEHDPNFKGPLQKRSCTDVLCLVIFLVFIGCWTFVGYYALTRGDIEKVINPTSSEGRKCGIDSEVKNMPYLIFFNLNDCLSLTSCDVQTACRESCPHENFVYQNLGASEILEQMKSKMICKFNVNLTMVTKWNQLDNLVNSGKCARWYLKSEPVLNRCLPLTSWDDVEGLPVSKENLDKANYTITVLAEIQKAIKYSLQDIKSTWITVILLIAGSGLVAIVHIILLKCLALPFVYTCILGICILLSYGIYEMNKSYSATNSSTALTGLIICSVILAVVVLCTLYLRKRIYLACQLIKESSKAVTNILSSLIFPIFPWVCQLAVIVFAVTVALFLASIGMPVYRVQIFEPDKCNCKTEYEFYQKEDVECDPIIFNEQCTENGQSCVSAGCHLMNVTRPWFINYMQGVNAFGLFWLFFFVSALGQMILAATFATWYWTFKKKDVPFFTITASIWRTFRYHIGTLAFGSIVITICSIIRIILSYISRKIQTYHNNQLAQGMITCCRCYFWMLERFLKYMNRNAYIMCAIHGNAFCRSARDAFNLIVRNVIRVVVLDKITEWLLLLGKLYITCLFAFLAWLCYGVYEVQPVKYWIVPVALVTVGAFLITSVFFSVYSAAVDTIFLCFLEDSERNDGSESRPYFMSRRLKKLLHR